MIGTTLRVSDTRALAQRREALLMRSAALRTQLAWQSQALAPPLAIADSAMGAWQWLRRHPGVPIAVAVTWIVVRPRRAWRMAARAWWLWRSLSWLRQLGQR